MPGEHAGVGCYAPAVGCYVISLEITPSALGNMSLIL